MKLIMMLLVSLSVFAHAKIIKTPNGQNLGAAYERDELKGFLFMAGEGDNNLYYEILLSQALHKDGMTILASDGISGCAQRFLNHNSHKTYIALGGYLEGIYFTVVDDPNNTWNNITAHYKMPNSEGHGIIMQGICDYTFN